MEEIKMLKLKELKEFKNHPFDNQISKDTGLYKLYNTNIHEKFEKENTLIK